LVGLEDLDFKVLQMERTLSISSWFSTDSGKGLVDVVEGEITLLLGVADELADLLV